MQPKYKIMATALDAYTYYLNSDNDEAFQSLIDSINRVSFTSESMEKGKSFEDAVNDFLKTDAQSEDIETIIKNGFNFKASIIREFAEKIDGALSQVYVEANLHTSKGYIMLYGYIDKVFADTAFDIKTTSSYVYPKYMGNWQHKVYPYCLKQMGSDINRFEYFVTDFSTVYSEEYIFNATKDTQDLINICEHFIDFIETHRELITDKKLFGGEKE